MISWEGLGWMLGFVLSGLALMFLGLVLFDLLLPIALYKEVENGNDAAGWLVAGFLISTGIVLSTAFRANAGWVQAMVDGVVGIVLNYLGFYLWEWCTPKWSLTDAIRKGSPSAGKVLFGIFVAIGLIISGSFS